jgi:hypothetical protein
LTYSVALGPMPLTWTITSSSPVNS